MQFNENLKELRLKKEMSQAELAEKVFVSRSAVAKWENGLGLPSDDSLNRLAEFFGVEREELYSDKAIEAVIVEKNKTIFKAHRWLIALGTICLTVIIALVLTIVIKNLHDNVRSGTEVGKMIGVQGKQRLIDGFINAIYLYDDKITFTFNYKDGTKTVFLSEINCTPSGSDIKCLAAPLFTKSCINA